MKRIIFAMGVMVANILITLSSCKKENQDTEIQDLTSVEESAVTSETYFDTFADISSLSAENDGLFNTSGSAIQIMGASAAIFVRYSKYLTTKWYLA